MPPKMKLEDYFPDLPSAPPSDYFFMLQERKDEIDEKLKEEAGGSTDKKELFKLRGQVSKTMWDGEFSFILYRMLTVFLAMTPKKKKSLNKKLKAKVTKYESELDEYLGALDDAKRCKYDEVSLISDFLLYNGSNSAQNGKDWQMETGMVGK